MVSLLIAVILAALIFDYINGFHDAANAVATVVSTGVLPFRTAILGAAMLNLIGAILGTAVAKTIAEDFTDPANATQLVVLSALLGACVWNLLTWYYGLPSSSSHALIGGLAGAVVANGGLDAFRWNKLVSKVLVPLVASPAIGFFAGFLFMIALTWAVRRMKPTHVHRWSRKAQLVSAGAMALSHGSNDAQKSMGIITLALLSYLNADHHLPSWVPHWVMPAQGEVPFWVILSCAFAIALGTAAGGSRIIKTMGTKIIRITPIQGFAAETVGAATILGASRLGIPVSTTHCINASIMGVGASKRLSGVQWGIASSIVMAWVLTLPASAGLAWAFQRLFALGVQFFH